MAASTATVDAILLRPQDTVAIASRSLEEGELISAGPHRVRMLRKVPQGHKVAVAAVKTGEPILRFGQIIGFATAPVEPGDWVHVHNLAAGAFERDYAFCSEIPPDPTPIRDRTFQGFRRANGKVGTRNYIAVISTVNCSASVSRYIVNRFNSDLLKAYPNIDGVVALKHHAGCAMQYDGEDHRQLSRTLAGFAKHANIGGFLLVGLGCETGAMSHLLQTQKLIQLPGMSNPTGAPKVLQMQDVGGTQKTVEAGLRALAELLPQANDVRRESIPAAEIILGLNCGGSDGNSGVTANPALGVASDLVVAAGGTSVLAETSEIYGAEHLLTRRSVTREVGEKLIERIRWWEDYTKKFGVVIDNNPSPGNKAGGLTTIYEKSLGAVAKGGASALRDVFHYAEPITTRGFVVMDTPGYDPTSVTGLVAGGVNVVCFTTGRGSCYGCKPAPSIKIATNTPMYERLSDDMDVNAGVVLDGVSLEDMGRQIFEKILSTCSGEKTKSELHGIGDDEFVPWSIGPVL